MQVRALLVNIFDLCVGLIHNFHVTSEIYY